MTSTSLMLSIRVDKPVPAMIVQLLGLVDAAARTLELPYVVSGATARDLLLNHVYGHEVPRPTRDVDVGIGIRNERDFDKLRSKLLEDRRFSPVDQVPHRLRFQPPGASNGIPLDIVPFAIPASAQVHQRAVLEDLPGFEEALSAAEQIRIADNLTVPVASLPGQTLLKLAAWRDRRAVSPNKDAADLLQYFRRYADSGNEDRVYGRMDLLEAAEYDVERAGAMLLGEDVRAIASPATYDKLTATFTAEVVRGPFVTQLSSGFLLQEPDRVPRAETLAIAFFDKFTNKSS
jgi:predicted nucleotidyltransferase